MIIKSQKELAKELLSVVSSDLATVDQVLRNAATVDYEPLAAVLQPILAAKGKRLRPALVLLAAKQHHYDLDRIIPAAAAVELLHTATLVHDDMIDGAATRRGVSTISSSLGDKVSVLVGDYLFAKAADLAADTNSVPVMHIFSRTLMTIADGQLQEMFVTATPEALRNEYLRRIGAKTASLFQASTTVGAILSGASPDATKALSDFGYNYGMAFQVIDDILDFAGDERELGKPVGSDLRQGTLTLPAIHLLQLVPENNPVTDIINGNGRSEAAIERAVRLVSSTAALDLSYADARRFIENAKSALMRLPNNPYRQVMIDLADIVIQPQ